MTSFSVNKDQHQVDKQEYKEALEAMDQQAVIKEFLSYLDYQEESDSGRVFHPIVVSSVRCMMTEPVGMVLQRMRVLVGVSPL